MDPKLIEVRIIPTFGAYRDAFYLNGVLRHFKGARFNYCSASFPQFKEHGLAIIVVDTDTIKRIFISSHDSPEIDWTAVEWSDVYGKLNLTFEDYKKDRTGKIVPCGPNLGVRAWGAREALWTAAKTYLKSRNAIALRPHIQGYLRQWKYRIAEEDYVPGDSIGNYVFFNASLWKEDVETNEDRARFIRACKRVKGLEFEGGFKPRPDRDVPGYEEEVCYRPYSFSEFLEKTRRSAVVFNTPAVMQCHSWRFGEYFALGKAIISTPLAREVAGPLTHGKNIHFVDGSVESVEEAIREIIANPSYRKRLENGAREYYLSWIKSDRMIERLVNSSARTAGNKEKDARLAGAKR